MTDKPISPYLLLPLRTEAQAAADIAAERERRQQAADRAEQKFLGSFYGQLLKAGE